MNQPNEITYKNTLYAATALFVFLMCAATSSLSFEHRGPEHRVKSEVTLPTTASEIEPITHIGRFVVTPSGAHFVSASATSQVELAPRAKLQGAL